MADKLVLLEQYSNRSQHSHICTHVYKVLLRECEEARGGVASSTSFLSPHDSSGVISSSSQVISQELVDFRNIDELQEQNQRLLGVVRELSEQNEKQERQSIEEQTRVRLWWCVLF